MNRYQELGSIYDMIINDGNNFLLVGYLGLFVVHNQNQINHQLKGKDINCIAKIDDQNYLIGNFFDC